MVMRRTMVKDRKARAHRQGKSLRGASHSTLPGTVSESVEGTTSLNHCLSVTRALNPRRKGNRFFRPNMLAGDSCDCDLHPSTVFIV